MTKPKCQVCGKPAEYNFQSGGCCLWSIDDKGNYEVEKEWGLGDDDNDHYCEACAEKEGII